MSAYQLYLRDDENSWDWIGTLEAATHAEAFRLVLRCLGPGDHERPIRVEQDTEGVFRKPLSRPRPSACESHSKYTRGTRQQQSSALPSPPGVTSR